VINHFASAEFGITRQFNNRWSFAFYIPVISNARSSMYEHYGNTNKSPNARRSTHLFGLGGDGGTGITLEANSYYAFSKRASVYFNAYYLSNPRGQNGVSTARVLRLLPLL